MITANQKSHRHQKSSMQTTRISQARTSKDKLRNETIRQQANSVLSKHSLKVNYEKWEITNIERSTSIEQEIEWRKTKKLGSLLGEYQDMRNRIELANAAMESVEKVWPSKKVKEKQRLKIYNAIVKSILTYNMATWGLTKAQEEEYDIANRKQLRKVTRDPYIKNSMLYERCRETKLSSQMKSRRWQALGHMLRLEESTPCQLAMQYYLNVPENAVKFTGRKRLTLPVRIDQDLKEAAKSNVIPIKKFENSNDLKLLRKIASNRVDWRRLSSTVCGEC